MKCGICDSKYLNTITLHYTHNVVVSLKQNVVI